VILISKNNFLLNKDITFLNHGSFGACPKIVFDKYLEWQRVLEFQPVDYFVKDLIPRLKKSRDSVGEFINAKRTGEDLLLVTNATHATNIVIKSLDLKPSDEIIIHNHEYGATLNALEFWQKEIGFKINKIHFELPLPKTNEIIDRINKVITKNTKVIFSSHISSKTAQIFPVNEICKFARENGIISVIDAAHSIGQFDNLDIQDIDPDFYYSNLHKWLFAPKVAAFLYVKKEIQSLVKPLIIGWGWGSEINMRTGNDFIDSNQYFGTNDFSAALTIPEAIKFYKDNNILEKKKECHNLVKYFISETIKITGKDNLYSSSDNYFMMAIVELPKVEKFTSLELKNILLEKYSIEIPIIEWEDKLFMRISIQVYNTKDEVDYLLGVLKELFK